MLRKRERLRHAAQRADAEPGEVLRRETGYFTDHRERLHDQRVAEAGAPIVSGAVESACARLQGRLKGSGKFWSVTHLLALDLARRNGDWDQDFCGNAA